MKGIAYATKANMERLYPKYGNSLVMVSPYTGEQYSANPGDYFMSPSNKSFKDTSGHVMRLAVRSRERFRQLSIRKKLTHPRVRR